MSSVMRALCIHRLDRLPTDTLALVLLVVSLHLLLEHSLMMAPVQVPQLVHLVAVVAPVGPVQGLCGLPTNLLPHLRPIDADELLHPMSVGPVLDMVGVRQMHLPVGHGVLKVTRARRHAQLIHIVAMVVLNPLPATRAMAYMLAVRLMHLHVQHGVMDGAGSLPDTHLVHMDAVATPVRSVIHPVVIEFLLNDYLTGRLFLCAEEALPELPVPDTNEAAHHAHAQDGAQEQEVQSNGS
mmetsp:Transcript_120208/g.268336  ORF Transcript_120208/g.268336 Transcript_120208/m.268336 type:complete len:239 (-) Transcript_120208:99-815(-)